MGRTIVVTGGTKGIGRAIIDRFAAEGFDVITCSRSQADLERLRKETLSDHNVKVEIFPGNMGVREEAKAFVEFVKGISKSPDVIVNNAGIFVPGKVHQEEDEVLDLMLDVNLKSAYWITKGLLPGMKEVSKGYIFNICSTASVMAYENGGSYSISKFALYGMSKNLREELKEYGIRVTSVLPGATYTASWEGSDLPEERFMKASDLADAVWNAYSLSPSTVVEELLLRPQLGDL